MPNVSSTEKTLVMELEEKLKAREHLLQALERSDEILRVDRAARIEWISQYDVRPGRIFAGRVEFMSLLSEAHDCFVSGHNIATLMLATAFIEHLLMGILIDANKAKHGLMFEEGIKIARKDRLFSNKLLDEADRLRLVRNPLAHLKPDSHVHRIGVRYRADKCHPNQIAAEEARKAIVAMYGFLDEAFALSNDE